MKIKSQLKRRPPVLGTILKKIAPRIGARVVIEPEWHIVGQIIFASGRKKYFRYSSLDINTLGASEIAKDKDYANFFMRKLGYPTVPNSKTFYRQDWGNAIKCLTRDKDTAYKHAMQIGMPVIVKPNSGSQGSHVYLARNKKQFYRAITDVFAHDRIAMVQSYIAGQDYRIVVLDDKVISAYERVHLHVVGDGKSSIKKLLEAKQKSFARAGRDTIVKNDDRRILDKLDCLRMTLDSIPKYGEDVRLLDNANLSTGGDAVDVTNIIHPEFQRIAINLTHDMGLRLCGVDMMVQRDISNPPVKGKYTILEINAAPGLDHYVSHGKAQTKIVEDMYLQVLKSMDK